jgi:hypothetical protein
MPFFSLDTGVLQIFTIEKEVFRKKKDLDLYTHCVLNKWLKKYNHFVVLLFFLILNSSLNAQKIKYENNLYRFYFSNKQILIYLSIEINPGNHLTVLYR